METVPWKPFPEDGKPPLAPPCPGQPPPGAPRGPPPARTSLGACSLLWGGGEDACRIGPGWVGEGMDVARQPASSITMATPPHPSWDAARPDDEVISRGERGRQAGSGDLPGPGRHPNLPATVTRCARKAGAARAGHPPRPPPSLHWGGQAALPIILLAAPARCLPEHQNPHGAVQIRSHPSSQLPDGGWAREWESGGPDMQSPPPTKRGPGAEKQGEGSRLPNTEGASLHPCWHPPPPEPPAASRR